MIEYHPHSERPTRIVSPEEFKKMFNDQPDPTAPPDDEPWHPFSTREDFDFAELVHDTKLNQKQIERFIDIINRCQKSPGSFTMRNHNDLKGSLEKASKLLTNFERHIISRKFEGDSEERKYEMWSRPMWNWIADHLADPELVRHFEWDAQKVFRQQNGGRSRIFTEPWTGERFWNVQSSLPKEAKVVCLEIYADKSKLSSFGTQKGYPVMARIVNLPVGIRNGKGVGGARVVGWLPVIGDPPEHKDKSNWVNFKRVIWHESFHKLLETIQGISETGRWVNCGDGIARRIFPLILILAADYEEQ